MTKLSIGVDMDNVLADWTGAALIRAQQVWNINIELSDITDMHTEKLIRQKLHNEGKGQFDWDILCNRGFYASLRPTIENLEHSMLKLSKIGTIYIVTTVLNWDNCPGEKLIWLSKTLPRVDYRVIMVENPEDKGLLHLDYMIDDDPRVIASLQDTTKGILVKHLWNKEYRHLVSNNEQIKYVENIAQACDYIEEETTCGQD